MRSILESVERKSQFFQVFIFIGNTWNKNVTYPYRLANLAQIAGTIQYVLIAMERQLAMLFHH